MLVELNKLSLTEAREALRLKKISVMDLVSCCVKASEERKFLNANISDYYEQAMEQARVAQSFYDRGEHRALEGLPLSIKDIFLVRGTITTAGSKMLANFRAPYTATVVEKIFNAGGIMLSKTNMDEFAMGSANVTSYFGPVKNPYRMGGEGEYNLVPGGSSGGSAAAVAANMSLGSMGSDTGGSIRQPAAFCGLVGLKPTYGRCSRYGMVGFASSLDCPGPIVKTVADAATMLGVTAGMDTRDAKTFQRPVLDYLSFVNMGVSGMRIGIVKEYEDAMFNSAQGNMTTDPEIVKNYQDSIVALKNAGAKVQYVSLPNSLNALAVYYIIAPAEASSNLARYDGVRYGFRVDDAKNLDKMYALSRSEGFGEEVKRRIVVGTYVLSSGFFEAYYGRAKAVQNLISSEFVEVFKQVDVIFTPTTPTVAFKIGQNQDDPLTMYLNDLFTVTANIAGICAISVPTGLTSCGLPLGMQFMGNSFREDNLIRAGSFMEQFFNFRPEIKVREVL